MPILQALLRAYGQLEARLFLCLTHPDGVLADVIQSHLGQRHAVERARGDAVCSLGRPCSRAGTTGIVRHVTARGDHCAHSGKYDRSIGVSERQGITARGAGDVRTDRVC
jgi:hypothetical protein